MRWLIAAALMLTVILAAGFVAYTDADCEAFLREEGRGRIAFQRLDGLYVMDMEGNGQCRIAEGGFGQIAWSPDGRQLAAVTHPEGELTVIAADGSSTQILADDIMTPGAIWARPSWSPDGTALVYVAEAGTDNHLVIINIGSGERRTLTEASGAVAPSWSPDGNHIAFIALWDKLFIIRPDGSQQMKLTDGVLQSPVPEWSPDGSRLLYVTHGQYDLVVMNLSDSTQEVFTTDVGGEILLPFAAQWSPDGTTIGVRFVGEGNDVYMLDPVTGNLDMIAPGAFGLDVAWSPDGTELIYTNASGSQADDYAIYGVDVETRAVRRLAAGYGAIVRP